MTIKLNSDMLTDHDAQFENMATAEPELGNRLGLEPDDQFLVL